MTCSLCGDVCRCVPDENVGLAHASLLESEADGWVARCHKREDFARLEDRSAIDQERSATHGGNLKTPRPKFVISSDDVTETSIRPGSHRPAITDVAEPADMLGDRPTHHSDLLTEPSEPSGRAEVTARLHRYQARRRPRAPRYPSLRLKFETPEVIASSSTRTADTLTAQVTDTPFFPG